MKINEVLLCIYCLLLCNCIASNTADNEMEIPVPDETWAKGFNITLRCAAILIYGYCLYWTIFNIIMFLILKKRYKDPTLLLYYVFFLALFIGRIAQALLQLKNLNDKRVKNAIVACDSFSVEIGLVQVSLIMELIVSLQYYDAHG